jgi:predicted nucleic acid-binding protein
MIHLDTCLLIAAVDASDAHHPLARLLAARQDPLATSAVAWMEFHARPVPELFTRSLHGMLRGGIIPFDQAVATLAGELIHRTGSKRRTRLDTMIAATAILVGAELATVDPDDFEFFLPHGLKLHPLP